FSSSYYFQFLIEFHLFCQLSHWKSILSTQPLFLALLTPITKRIPPVYLLKINLGETLQTLFYQYFNRSYSSTIDINATNSTWDELIQLMYLRFLVKWSYAGTYRLFRTFVGIYQFNY